MDSPDGGNSATVEGDVSTMSEEELIQILGQISDRLKELNAAQ